MGDAVYSEMKTSTVLSSVLIVLDWTELFVENVTALKYGVEETRKSFATTNRT